MMAGHYEMPSRDLLLGTSNRMLSTPTGSALNALADFDQEREIDRQRQATSVIDFGRRMARYDQEIPTEQLSAEALGTRLGQEQMASQDQFMEEELRRLIYDAATGAPGTTPTTESVYPRPRHETMSGDSRVDPESKDLLIYDGSRWVTVSNRKADEHHIALVENSIINLKYALEEMEVQSREQQALRQHVNPNVIEDITDDEFKDLI